MHDSDLGYDPTDRHSFPYQRQDPPFDATSLRLEPISIDRAPMLDTIETIAELLNLEVEETPVASTYRMLDMALRLFYKISGDTAYNDIAFPDLFAACCDTAMIWERG